MSRGLTLLLSTLKKRKAQKRQLASSNTLASTKLGLAQAFDACTSRTPSARVSEERWATARPLRPDLWLHRVWQPRTAELLHSIAAITRRSGTQPASSKHKKNAERRR